MSLRPSYFELIAADRLSSTLKAALRFALRVYSVNDARIRSLSRYEDELLLLISAFLETGSVCQYAASFSEAVYGLTRRIRGTTPPRRRPSKLQLILSIVSLLGLPYVQSRLEKLYENILAHRESLRATFPNAQPLEVMSRSMVEEAFVKGYPYCKLYTDLLSWIYQFLYLTGQTNIYSPILHLLNLQVYTISPDELRKDEKMKILRRVMALKNIRDQASTQWIQLLWQCGLKTFYFVTDNLRRMLIFSIFLFKALEWWYLIGEDRFKDQRRLPIPPAPPAPAPHPDGIPLPVHRPDLCPVCLLRRSNPTQLTASGYVFCYECIFRYVSAHSRCPITLTPANLNQLRRLYKGSTTM